MTQYKRKKEERLKGPEEIDAMYMVGEREDP